MVTVMAMDTVTAMVMKKLKIDMHDVMIVLIAIKTIFQYADLV